MAKFDARAAGTKVRKTIVVGMAQAMTYGRGEHAGWSQGSKEMAEFAVKRPLNINVETSIKLVNNTDERLTLAR